ncbi:gamma-tubulin complex component 2 [Trichonephila clavipes]|uniref:Gamma-tubulin complex component n=1 Tax=Trichonephila clavipes TaxID=2585209 RepID=A0A8X6VC06_TRICX|nr:gamma-tubulin complex component 2 [Trichonephila clavipes]
MYRVREVDPLLTLLYKIQCDEKVKNLLVKDEPNKVNGYPFYTEKLNHTTDSQLSGKDVQKPEKDEKSKKKNVPQGIYALPDWVDQRNNLSWDFKQEPRPDFIHCGPIGVLPPNVQESRLIDDILFCLVGIDGDYVYSKKLDKHEKLFLVDDTTNVALKLLVQNMVPMFSHYSTTMSFVERNIHYEQGLVNHALSSAMRTFLKDYFVLVSQLENQHLQHNLTLQKLWFYLQPSLTTMETIANIASILTKLPAPGNRSNERRYREKDLATLKKKGRNGRSGCLKKPGREKNLLSPAELGYGINRCRIFSSVSDEWSRDLKSVQVQKQLSCRVNITRRKRQRVIGSYYSRKVRDRKRQKLEQQEQLSIEKLRLEMELSRIANQSANQNNGQTSLKNLDEIVKMVKL